VTQIWLDAAWTITGHLNGGYLTSVCGRAASDALDGAPPLTISTHFLHPARGAGPADVEVDVVRRGRLSTARVTLSRDGLALVDAFVTTGSPRDTPVEVDAAVPPLLPPIDECPDAGADQPVEGMALLHTLEVRPHPAVGHALAGGPALDDMATWGWVRYRDGRPVDAALLMAAWDVLPPTPWAAHVFAGTPTVSSQVVLYPGDVVGPLVIEARCDTLRGGIIDETARVWDSTGRLVSSARQTAILAMR
jgi:acyl-CoA thioesterase